MKQFLLILCFSNGLWCLIEVTRLRWYSKTVLTAYSGDICLRSFSNIGPTQKNMWEIKCNFIIAQQIQSVVILAKKLDSQNKYPIERIVVLCFYWITWIRFIREDRIEDLFNWVIKFCHLEPFEMILILLKLIRVLRMFEICSLSPFCFCKAVRVCAEDCAIYL